MLATARAICGPASAEDVVQDAWVTAFTRIDSFEGRARLGTWLQRIVVNGAITHLRARTSRAAPATGPDEEPFHGRFDVRGHWSTLPTQWHLDTPDALLSAAALQDCIDKTLAAMPDMQRTVLQLRDVDEISFEEICNELDLSPSNARVLLHRARSRLMQMVERFQETGTC
jgi:RNA polymerase sigma-70 factor (ECF subfamily)